MALSIEKVSASVELGEGPHWDVKSQSLYYVDIYAGTIYKYVPGSGETTKAIIGNSVSFIIPIQGTTDKFAISINRQLAIITWDGESETVSNVDILGEVDSSPEHRGNRINDGKADPVGRIWFGTMGQEKVLGHFVKDCGSLYSFGKERVFRKHLGNIGISNGLAWTADGDKMYYIDSLQKQVWQFDYDLATGTISNQKTIFTFEKHGLPGFPDGQTIDTDGNLWIAVYDGHRVIKIDPRKPETLLQTVEISSKKVTSVAFGGKNLDELYVTTARFTVDGVVSPANEGHGWVYVIKDLGVKGYPPVNVQL